MALAASAAASSALLGSATMPVGAQGEVVPLAVPSRPVGEVGTVDTIAGPGFCDDIATLDTTSTTVRSLAVGADGGTYVDTGPLAEALVGKVDVEGRVSLVPTGARRSVRTSTEEVTASEPAPGRLSSDGNGGVLVAAGSSVVHLALSGALTTVVGRPAAGGPPLAPGPGAAGGVGDAGAGAPGPGGDGPAATARFTSIASIASDAEGGVYIADRLEPGGTTVRVRFANLGGEARWFYRGTAQELTVEVGETATLAGPAVPVEAGADESPGTGGDGDGGPALEATLGGSFPVMASEGQLLYLTSEPQPGAGERSGDGFSTPPDRGEVSIRVINLGAETAQAHGESVAAGAIETVAGGGPAGFGGDGGPALGASFGDVTGIDADGDGNLFLADTSHHRVRRVDGGGVITTFAGTGGTGPGDGGFNGNDRLATSARLHRPFDVKVGPQNRVYISDRFNHQLRFVDEVGLIRAAPGNGVGMRWACSSTGDAGPAGAEGGPRPTRGSPSGLAVDGDGAVYLANLALPQIKRLESSERVTTAVGLVDRGAACPPSGCTSVAGGPGAEIRLASPEDLAVGPGGGLYIREANTPRVRLANLGTTALSAHGITIVPGAVETVAGDGIAGNEGDGGSALDARLAPNGAVAADASGNLLLAEPDVVDPSNVVQPRGRVRQVGPDGEITTLVGGDGAPAGSSCCQEPAGLLVDPDGNLYVSDLRGHQVWYLNRGPAPVDVHGRSVAPGEIAVVAGTGTGGFAGEGGPAIDAQLDEPAGLALDRAGNLYIANQGPRDDSIRRVDPGGTIATVAGSSTGSGFNGDGLKAGLTAFTEVTDVAIDACGNLIVAEQGGDRVRRVNLTAGCGESAAPPQEADEGSLALPLILAAAAAAGGGGWLVVRRLRRRP
jgi:hypothetical protein